MRKFQVILPLVFAQIFSQIADRKNHENLFKIFSEINFFKIVMFESQLRVFKVPLISLCRIISVECPINLNFPLLTTNQNTGRSKQPISVKNLLGSLLKLFGKAKLKGL